MSADLDDVWSSLPLPSAFGARHPQLLLNPHSTASDNLVEKALRAWDSDCERASDYIERAVRFPYDAGEQTFPVLWAAHMALFCDVNDAVEAADVDDRHWLDAAIEVLHTADETGRRDLGDVLRTIADEYGVNHKEAAVIAAA